MLSSVNVYVYCTLGACGFITKTVPPAGPTWSLHHFQRRCFHGNGHGFQIHVNYSEKPNRRVFTGKFFVQTVFSREQSIGFPTCGFAVKINGDFFPI